MISIIYQKVFTDDEQINILLSSLPIMKANEFPVILSQLSDLVPSMNTQQLNHMKKSLQSIKKIIFPNQVETNRDISKFHHEILDNLTNLEYLYIGSNYTDVNYPQIDNLDFVLKFPNLKELVVVSQKVNNIEAVRKLTHLNRLELCNLYHRFDEQKLFDLICFLFNSKIININITSFEMKEELMCKLITSIPKLTLKKKIDGFKVTTYDLKSIHYKPE